MLGLAGLPRPQSCWLERQPPLGAASMPQRQCKPHAAARERSSGGSRSGRGGATPPAPTLVHFRSLIVPVRGGTMPGGRPLALPAPPTLPRLPSSSLLPPPSSWEPPPAVPLFTPSSRWEGARPSSPASAGGSAPARPAAPSSAAPPPVMRSAAEKRPSGSTPSINENKRPSSSALMVGAGWDNPPAVGSTVPDRPVPAQKECARRGPAGGGAWQERCMPGRSGRGQGRWASGEGDLRPAAGAGAASGRKYCRGRRGAAVEGWLPVRASRGSGCPACSLPSSPGAARAAERPGDGRGGRRRCPPQTLAGSPGSLCTPLLACSSASLSGGARTRTFGALRLCCAARSLRPPAWQVWVNSMPRWAVRGLQNSRNTPPCSLHPSSHEQGAGALGW